MRFLLAILALFVIGGFVDAAGKSKIVMQPFVTTNDQVVGPIGMGTPTQPMYLIIDTMSTDFFLIDYSKCKANGACKTERNGYQQKKSSTYFNFLPFPFSSNYPDGKQRNSGHYVSDKLTALETGSAPRVPFPLVDKPSKFMVDSQVDGVLGVGFQQKPSLIPPFFGLLTLALGTPVYTYHMENFGYNSKGELSDQGNIAYGGNYAAKCEDQYEYYSLSKKNQFVLQLQSISIGSGSSYFGSKNSEILVRPGQQRLYGSLGDIKEIAKTLGASYSADLNEFVIGCDKLKDKKIRLDIGGKVLELTDEDYSLPLVGDSTQCSLLIGYKSSSKSNGNADWVIGNLLMRRHCVQFDMSKKQIGLAKPKSD